MRVTVKQDVNRLREGGYPAAGDQLGALCKILDALVDALPPGTRAKLPIDALAVLDEVRATKAKFPKGGRK